LHPLRITNRIEQNHVRRRRKRRGWFPRYSMATSDPPVMTPDEVAEYLRIPKASLYKLAQQGRIPCQKVGKHWRFHKPALEQWLSNSYETGQAKGEVNGAD
jgi:excisionase family DNA binding protein